MLYVSIFSAVMLGSSALCYANPACQERTIYTTGSLATADYDWGANSVISSVDGAIYELDHPYNGTDSHGDIDYHCDHGSYVIHAAPASSPGTDGKIYEYCSYALVSVECHD
jgi:hypothetical protein